MLFKLVLCSKKEISLLCMYHLAHKIRLEDMATNYTNT